MGEYQSMKLPAERRISNEFASWSQTRHQASVSALVNAEPMLAFLESKKSSSAPWLLQAIVLKGLGLTLREHPEARTLYYSPPPRLVRFEVCNAVVLIEREHAGQRKVFPANIKDCDKRRVQDISFELARLRDAPLREVPSLGRWLWLSRLPKVLREPMILVFQNVSFLRAGALGTFGLASLDSPLVDEVIPTPGLTVSFGAGGVKERPVVENGLVVARKTLQLSMLIDLRAIDGPPAVRFFEACVRRIEKPDFLAEG